MRIILIVLMLLFASAAAAETRYVDDKLVITLRTGKGNSYQIVKTLPSGTRLELLEESGDYSRVRTDNGIEGWALNQYLTATPIARDRLVRANQQLERLQAEKEQLQQQLNAISKERAELSRELSGTTNEAQQLREELEELKRVAAKPVELAQQNRQLREQLTTLQQQKGELESDNQRLADRSQREWFITGAAVLGGGIILGLILPLLRRRKKSGMFD
ncbi:MAG: TIGR04211 family SH3 domain-containing protein [Gammaproteobacteria bacterium]|nr:TIGR04211 family SH3 domain-containing protein [Gammaproteobacteria bacterium]MCW8927997.1 TIGR04211 family SH3 domain-containing protein [Gammaproteobacteria bacterium]MCW8958198.1 TIGR04211 family SH3 domain-containing protein [Gammaproteobacteria bacterium]MCW8972203.1 TIGR04211 family SH3 domain-containing protein [Gammaproteobacteria bacterium]MCW8993926.1 TIGR04211 family SH3 domain-containing protein [Gammaproteobacteria bacterium]